MRKMILTMIIMAISQVHAQQSTLKIDDLRPLDNTLWEGNLTYKNYSDNKEVTLPTNLEIMIEDKVIVMKTKFPNEPKANSTNRTKLKKNGQYFGKEKIINIERLKDSFSFTTSYIGIDNGEKTPTQKRYEFNEKELTIVKTIFPEGGEAFVRNSFRLKKKQ